MESHSIAQMGNRDIYSPSITKTQVMEGRIKTHVVMEETQEFIFSELPTDLQKHTAGFMEYEDLFAHKSMFSTSLRNVLIRSEKGMSRMEIAGNFLDYYSAICDDSIISLLGAFPHFSLVLSKKSGRPVSRNVQFLSKISALRVFGNLHQKDIENSAKIIQNSKIDKIEWIGTSFSTLLCEKTCDLLSQTKITSLTFDLCSIDEKIAKTLFKAIAESKLTHLKINEKNARNLSILFEFLPRSTLTYLELGERMTPSDIRTLITRLPKKLTELRIYIREPTGEVLHALEGCHVDVLSLRCYNATLDEIVACIETTRVRRLRFLEMGDKFAAMSVKDMSLIMGKVRDSTLVSIDFGKLCGFNHTKKFLESSSVGCPRVKIVYE